MSDTENAEKEKLAPYTPKTDDEIRELAVQVHNGQIFGTWNLAREDQGLVTSIFMPLIFMSPEQRQQLIDDEIVHIYQHLSKAEPRSINGYPSFFSMKLLNKDESQRLLTVIERLENAQASALAGSISPG